MPEFVLSLCDRPGMLSLLGKGMVVQTLCQSLFSKSVTAWQDYMQRVGHMFVGLARIINVLQVCVYVRYFWQGNHQIDVHVWRMYTVLADPKKVRFTPQSIKHGSPQ